MPNVVFYNLSFFKPPQVELHLPEFWDPISGPIFPNRGDQERFWRMTRRFLEQLAISLGSTGYIRAVRALGVGAGRGGRGRGEGRGRGKEGRGVVYTSPK